MSDNFVNEELFSKFQEYFDHEQELRDNVRQIIRAIETASKKADTKLQVIHSCIDKERIGAVCAEVRKDYFSECVEGFKNLAEIIPTGQYYRYNDHWNFTTQKLIFLIGLTVYLETDGELVTREQAAETLGLKCNQSDGFHLDIEDYLLGILQMASELTRFATNSVTLGDYSRALKISKFLADLNSGFRCLNLKNDSIRKRYDGLKYEIKKIEGIRYDISIRGLIPANGNEAATN